MSTADRRTGPRGLSISAVLVVFALVIGLPVLGFCAVALSRYAEAERREAVNLASSVARSLSVEIDKDLAAQLAMLDVLARSPLLVSDELSAFYEMAVLALGRRDVNVVLRDREGQQLLNTREAWAASLPKVPLSDVDRQVIETRRPQVTGLFRGAVAERPIYAVTGPVVRQGEVTGLLHLSLDPERLTAILKGPALRAGWKAAILDRHGVAMAASDAPDVPAKAPFDLGSIRGPGAIEGVRTIANEAGQEQLLAFARSATAGWTVAAWTPLATIQAPLQRGWWLLAAFGAVSIAFSAVLASIVGSIIARPIRWLAEAGPSLAAGRRFYGARGYLREANEVGRALVEASVTLSRRDDALRASDARLRSQLHELEAVYETAPIGIVVMDTDLRISRVNRRFARIVGQAAEAPVGRSIWDMAPGLRARAEPIFRDVLTTGRETRDVELTGQILASGEYAHDWLGHFYPLVGDDRAIIGVGMMIEEVAQRRRNERANAQLAAMVMASGDAIMCLSTDGTILTWNPAAERLFGYAATEAVGHSARLLYPAEAEAEFDSNYRRLRAGESLASDTVRKHRDGHALDVAINIAPMRRGEEGPLVGFVAVVRDIREQKRREEHVRFILRELSHRTKNLLAIVQAMARQTAIKSESIDDFERRFSGRLQGLAHSHDLLVKEEWTGVSIKALVRTQLASFLEPGDARLDASGPNLRLRPEAAQPLGLALHEMATNATKYGALSVPEGRVTVRWEHDPEAHRLRITWRERGGPKVVPPETRGFGYQLVDWMVASAMDGTVSIAFPPEGLEWTLDVTDDNLSSSTRLSDQPQPVD